jgi:CheY-like chemotaxis protein
LRLRHQHANVSEILRNTVQDYQKAHTLGQCELRVNIPSDDVWVWADPARLTQAFSNILHNSYKFSDGPNEISVEMKVDSVIGNARIDVRDRGIGMAPETLERIFEPFTQADNSLERSRGGLGLGLALAQGLVRLHGGSVSAASDGLGKGAVISITLPTVSPPSEEQQGPDATSSRPRRVLIIDDRRDAILPLKKMLEMDGHEVATALDGPAGIAKAVEVVPEIILCDIGLVGDMNGYGVSRALRAMEGSDLSSSYLVAVTGYGHDEARRMAREAGFDFHVTKPVGSEQLRDLMARMPRF